MSTTDTSLGVALIGTGFMGKCHALAWRQVAATFGVAHPRLEVLCATSDEKSVQYAQQWGFDRGTADWETAIQHPSVDVVSVTTPNGLHRAMAEVALRAGKHVWMEKPMAGDLADSEAMTALASAHPDQVTLLGYNYLWSPAYQAARQMVTSGELGAPMAFRGVYDEDYFADPNFPFHWRMTRAEGGLGALGDLGCHLVGHMMGLMGDVAEITAQTHKAIPTRETTDGPRDVENEDSAMALIRFTSGAQGSFATSRVARGRKCRLQWEVHCTEGTIVFDQENMNELWVHKAGEAGFTRHLTGPDQPDYAAFCPAPGHNFGYNEQKVIELRNLIRAINGGAPCGPDFAEGLKIERIIHAMATSDGRPVSF